MKSISLFFISVLFISNVFSQKNVAFVHYPEISPDGNELAFSYQGDIWKMNLDDKKAIRLTIHEGYEFGPLWSPDGSMITFTGNRNGNNDVFVFSNNSLTIKRLTYHSTNDYATGWKTDNTILFNTDRLFKQVERDPEIHEISSLGGTPKRLLNCFGRDATVSPNGRYVAITMGSCRLSREAYTGPANRDIWLYDNKTNKYIQITKSRSNDFLPNWVGNETIYFLSARSGNYNLCKIKIDADGIPESDTESITNYKETGITHFSIDEKGKKVVFDQGDRVYLLNIENKEVKEIDFKLPYDERFDLYETKVYTKSMNEYIPSPDGKLLAFIVRGEVFVKLNDKDAKKSKAKQITDTPAREKNVAWLNDSTILYISDRNSQYDIFMAQSADKDESNIFKTLKIKEKQLTNSISDEEIFELSPDKNRIAYRENWGKLIVAEIDNEGKLINPQEILNNWDKADGISWSPDSKWLAYSLEDLNFNEEVYIQSISENSKPVNVSLHPKYDVNPVWSRDGKKLFFLSERNNHDMDVWMLWLKKEDWEKTNADWTEIEIDDAKKEDSVVVEIDFENIHRRLVQVTSMPGNEGSLAVDKEGEFVYFTAFNGFRQSYGPDNAIDMYKIKWNGTELKRLTEGNSKPVAITLDEKGENIYFINGKSKELQKVDIKGDKIETLPFKATIIINHAAEREQIFNEACRELDKGFYDPNFHMVDWDMLKIKYKPWCEKASTIQDFRRVFNQMLGQLNSSHMGLYNGEKPEKLQKEVTGELGIEVEHSKTGLEIKYVLPGSPASKKGVELMPGDIITAINGEKLNNNENLFKHLANKANEKVILEILRKSTTIEVVIRPVSNVSLLKYDAWVESRRKIVEEISGGKLGYIHIRGMSLPYYESFVTELTATCQNKEGLIIDVRYNGGGWTTDYLMAVLNVKQHAYTIPRGASDNLEKEHQNFREYYPYGPRLPMAAWLKPSIAICNSSSYSNAEIFSHAYQSLGFGSLVGEPTFGAVISTGGYNLIDGSFVRMPFRAWYVKETGQNMEGNPAIPDFIIENTKDYRNNKDNQLIKAINVLQNEMESEK